MKLRKIVVILTAVVVLLLLTVPVFAQALGSLVVLDLEQPTVLYKVADKDGVVTEAFAPAGETKLTEDKLSPTLAKTLYTYAKNNQLQGVSATPDEAGTAAYPSLELGYYLVCSTAEKGEFAPFLVKIPMSLGGKSVYDIQAQPKIDTPEGPLSPADPKPPKPNIPQTGNIQWPKYLLLILGGLAILAGFVEVVRGREKHHE